MNYVFMGFAVLSQTMLSGNRSRGFPWMGTEVLCWVLVMVLRSGESRVVQKDLIETKSRRSPRKISVKPSITPTFYYFCFSFNPP